jgi:hypothetical protein
VSALDIAMLGYRWERSGMSDSLLEYRARSRMAWGYAFWTDVEVDL